MTDDNYPELPGTIPCEKCSCDMTPSRHDGQRLIYCCTKCSHELILPTYQSLTIPIPEGETCDCWCHKKGVGFISEDSPAICTHCSHRFSKAA